MISWGTAVEHHTLYQYQFLDTRNTFMGQIQTETAYYQPNPDATLPFPPNPALNDPVFAPFVNNNGTTGPNSTASTPSTASGWGLRIVRSNNIFGYGAGLYSFFDNYSTACSAVGAGTVCQTAIFSVEGGRLSYAVDIYNLNTVGATQMITRDGVEVVGSKENNSTFVDTVNLFRIDAFGR